MTFHSVFRHRLHLLNMLSNHKVQYENDKEGDLKVYKYFDQVCLLCLQCFSGRPFENMKTHLMESHQIVIDIDDFNEETNNNESDVHINESCLFYDKIDNLESKQETYAVFKTKQQQQ